MRRKKNPSAKGVAVAAVVVVAEAVATVPLVVAVLASPVGRAGGVAAGGGSGPPKLAEGSATIGLSERHYRTEHYCQQTD